MAARPPDREGRPAGPDEHDEYVQFGSPRRWPGWLSRLLLACLVVVAVVVVVSRSGRSGPASTVPAPTPAPPVPESTVPASALPVLVMHAGHPLLGVRAGWELFGLDSAGLVSIRPATGTITSTTLPAPEGDGPVSLVAEPHAVIIRPLDNVPGYVVPDGEHARPLTGLLATGSLLLPGPTPSQEWVVAGSGNSVTLLSPTGQSIGHLTLPAGQQTAQSAMSDGRGGVLVSGVSGRQYDANPGSLTPVRTLLAAVGPTRWLGVSCSHRPCQNVVIDQATGSQRLLPGPAVRLLTWPWPDEPGVVAPDGETAAVAVAHGNTGVALELINLASGAATPIRVPVTQNASSQTMAWSPDSNWLFVIAAGGQLTAVDARTGLVHSLGVALPALSQIAIQPG